MKKTQYLGGGGKGERREEGRGRKEKDGKSREIPWRRDRGMCASLAESLGSCGATG